MASITRPNLSEPLAFHSPTESHGSGVSWGAVIGGAFVAAAFALILLALGAGLGLSAVSPWSGSGISSSEVGASAIAWLIFTEVVASALGGYLTGRLRTKWASIHTDEVFFRDTANGFLAWAVAVIMTVTFLASATVSMAGSAARVATSTGDPNAYYIDALFRTDQPTTQNANNLTRAEAGRLFANALLKSDFPAEDRSYLAQLIVNTTGISSPDANTRVSNEITKAREAEDQTRKATARFLLWFFLALLMGAFSASFAATIGGRQRDHVKPL